MALKSGSGLALERETRRVWPGLLVLSASAALLALPPWAGIPVGAYLSIALLLVAAILLKPLLAPWLFAPLARWIDRRAAAAPWWLAATRLAATPRFASVGAAGIVASFALMVAMATMVSSFRHSVDDWLGRVLPADIYVRAGATAGGSLGATTIDERVHDPLELLHRRPRQAPPPRQEAPAELKPALAALDLSWPLTLDELKARWKALVKRHHPDANGGDPKAEERVKAINQAYTLLRGRLKAAA
jgi:hypothetical protein